MPRVLVAGKIHDAALAVLRSRTDLEVVVIEDPGTQLPADEIARADAILIRYGVLTAAAAAEAKFLRIVSRHGVGCDNLPVAALSARGIPVTIVGAVTAVSVAEQAFAMILAAVKRLTEYDRAVRNGNWAIRDSLGTAELSGKTLLVLGCGRIGREVAKRAVAFDLKVLAFDPGVSRADAQAAGVQKIDQWRDVLGDVDVLSLHLPLTEETRNVIDSAVLVALKATAIVVNTARGGLIDEDGLFNALTTRMANGAACLDTFALEPPDLSHPLFGLPNVVLSPHSAALTAEAARRMGVVAAQNVLNGLDGKLDPALIFNRQALQARTGPKSAGTTNIGAA